MKTHILRTACAGLVAASLAWPAAAQHEGHSMPMPAPRPAAKKPAAKPVVTKPATRPATRPAAKAPPRAAAAKPRPAPAAVDHSAMGHGAHAAHGAARPAKPAAKAAPRPAKAAQPPSARKTPAKAPAAMDHAARGHRAAKKPASAVDHGAHGHAPPAATTGAAVDQTTMGHGTPAQAVDHAAMGHGTSPSPADHDGMDHAAMGHASDPADHGGMDHAAMGHGSDRDLPANAAPRTPIPPLTDADRAAAFPSDAHGHHVHDRRVFSYWLVDRLEWQDTDDGGLGWEGLAWVGGDIHRLWLRTEGEATRREVESGQFEALYGRSVTPWWDAIAGVRHDFGHGPSRTYAAFGVQGLAPYKFEVEATAFVGAGGRGGASVEAEYDTLVTNRLILQWQAGATLHAKDDPGIGVASGLSTIEAGARLRYEFSRRFAPYVGVQHERAFGGTADLRRDEGEPTRDTRLVAGVRFWF